MSSERQWSVHPVLTCELCNGTGWCFNRPEGEWCSCVEFVVEEVVLAPPIARGSVASCFPVLPPGKITRVQVREWLAKGPARGWLAKAVPCEVTTPEPPRVQKMAPYPWAEQEGKRGLDWCTCPRCNRLRREARQQPPGPEKVDPFCDTDLDKAEARQERAVDLGHEFMARVRRFEREVGDRIVADLRGSEVERRPGELKAKWKPRIDALVDKLEWQVMQRALAQAFEQDNRRALTWRPGAAPWAAGANGLPRGQEVSVDKLVSRLESQHARHAAAQAALQGEPLGLATHRAWSLWGEPISPTMAAAFGGRPHESDCPCGACVTLRSQCDCGGRVARTPHSDWCATLATPRELSPVLLLRLSQCPTAFGAACLARFQGQVMRKPHVNMAQYLEAAVNSIEARAKTDERAGREVDPRLGDMLHQVRQEARRHRGER